MTEKNTIMNQAEEKNVQTGQVFVIQHDELEPSSLDLIADYVKQTFQVSSLICLGPQSTRVGSSQAVLTASEYIISLFRTFNLHDNEREVLLSAEDQLIVVQLCLAELNRKLTGDFDVEVSKVLEFEKRLQKKKLALDSNPDDKTILDTSLFETSIGSDSDKSFDSFLAEYAEFLKFNNHIDIMDVINRIHDEVKVNKELLQVIDSDSFLLLETPKDKLECELSKLLFRDKAIQWVRLEQPLVTSDDSPVQVDQIRTEPTDLDCLLNTTTSSSFPFSTRVSVTEHHIEKLMLGYLHLLVNTRSEIALARVINTPERGISHKVFTDIKHLAQDKQLSMYQTVTSFVMKCRLGLQKDNSDTISRLSQHLKGLGDFTDLMNKLQTILEEDPHTESAVKRILNVIKKTIIACHDNSLHPSTIDHVKERLHEYANYVTEVIPPAIRNSPGRSVSAGGSLVGRQSLRVLRSILDHEATQPPAGSVLDSLTTVVSSQKTPLKFPSVMSQFRSPLEASPGAPESKSLAQRIKERMPKKKPCKTHYKSAMDWAEPLHDSGLGLEFDDEPAAVECMPSSKTVEHPGNNSTKQHHPDPDQENTRDTLISKPPSNNRIPLSENKATLSRNTERSICEKVKPSKRQLDDVTKVNTSKKRIKLQDSELGQSHKAKTGKKKMIPLQKGQKTLTAFFRM